MYMYMYRRKRTSKNVLHRKRTSKNVLHRKRTSKNMLYRKRTSKNMFRRKRTSKNVLHRKRTSKKTMRRKIGGTLNDVLSDENMRKEIANHLDVEAAQRFIIAQGRKGDEARKQGNATRNTVLGAVDADFKEREGGIDRFYDEWETGDADILADPEAHVEKIKKLKQIIIKNFPIKEKYDLMVQLYPKNDKLINNGEWMQRESEYTDKMIIMPDIEEKLLNEVDLEQFLNVIHARYFD